MEARATFGGAQVTAGLLRLFVGTVFAALVIGGAGGYVIRGVTTSTATGTTTDVHRPFVIEQPPYSQPSSSPRPQPIYAPDGNPVPV